MQLAITERDQSLFPHETPVATYACQQTSARAAQPCRLMAAFFRERMGLRRLGSPRRASRMNADGFATASFHAGLEIYNEELRGLFAPRCAHESEHPTT